MLIGVPGSALTALGVLAALAAGFRSPLAILSEVARIVLRAAATAAVFTTPTAGFGRPLTIIGEIA